MSNQAETAANLFERLGLDALENYIRHARPEPYEAPIWKEQGSTIVLGDGGVVRHAIRYCPQHPDESPHFHFQWQDGDGEFHEVVHPAPDPIAAQSPLDDELKSVTLLNWPHTESIQLIVLEKAREQAGNAEYVTDDESADLAVMDTLAPASRRAVNLEIFADQQPNGVVDLLESLQFQPADDAIARIPQPQWDALVAHLQSNH